MYDLFGENYPRFENSHTRVFALGLAVKDQTVFYLSAAGAGPSVKSIWGSLVGSKTSFRASEWGSDLTGTGGLRTEYKALPHSNFQHMVSFPRENENLLLLVNPKAALYFSDLEIDHVTERAKLLDGGMPGVYENFIARLNKRSEVPLLKKWGKSLWELGLEDGALVSLESFGDALGAWIIRQDFVWLPLVQRLLTSGAISF